MDVGNDGKKESTAEESTAEESDAEESDVTAKRAEATSTWQTWGGLYPPLLIFLHSNYRAISTNLLLILMAVYASIG